MPVARQNTATKTPLFVRHQPGGPYLYADILKHPGEIFFVQSTSARGGDTAGHGRNPEEPFLTLEYAMSQTTADRGDVIYLMPGHVELVATAGALAMDVAGVHVIGCGNGTIQPIIRFTLAGADMNVTAANVTMENIHFQAGVANVLLAIHVTAADFTIRKCRFTEQGTDLNALVWIIDDGAAAADNITVEDCLVYAADSDNDAFIRFTGTGDGHVLRRNVLIGDWDNVAAIGGVGAVTHANISDNYIYNTCTTADSCISMAAGATGVCMNNMVTNGHATQKILATGMAKCYNYAAVIGEDLNGIPEPAMA